MNSGSFPGMIAMLVLACVSQYLSSLVEVAGKHPLEASALAIVIGVLCRNAFKLPDSLKPGLKFGEKFLLLGIVLLGAGLDFGKVAAQGVSILGIIIGTMIISYVLIYYLAQQFKLEKTLAVLLACGTTICGTSAIAIVAPLIKAKDEETSYAVGTVALWGLVAILVYPLLGNLAGASDLGFGVFAGTAIHSTPQVVGAGFIFSDLAGQTATTVKLVRNCFMAPIAMVIAIWWQKTGSNMRDAVQKKNLARAFPWFLFGYILVAILATYAVIGKELSSTLQEIAKFLVVIAMAGIGLNTDLKAFKSVGIKPLLVGLIGALVVAAISAALIKMWL